MKKTLLILTLLLATVAFSACNKENASQGGFFESNQESTSKDPENSGEIEESGDENERKEYVVLFDSLGGTTVQSQIVVLGEKIIRPIDPTKPDDSKYEYAFAGWYFEGKEWDFERDTVSENITLTAKWDIESIFTTPFLPSN